jgi:6-phosphogluconate dehydrogenase (decarboxylating)
MKKEFELLKNIKEGKTLDDKKESMTKATAYALWILHSEDGFPYEIAIEELSNLYKTPMIINAWANDFLKNRLSKKEQKELESIEPFMLSK